MSGFDEQDFFDQHNDLCDVCNLPGDLLCCATCSLVFHLTCVRPKLLELPDDDWRCGYCLAAGVMGGAMDREERMETARACQVMDRMREQSRGGMELKMARWEAEEGEEVEGLGEHEDMRRSDEGDKKPAAGSTTYGFTSVWFASIQANIAFRNSVPELRRDVIQPHSDGRRNNNYRKGLREMEKRKRKVRRGVSGGEHGTDIICRAMKAGLMAENEASESSDEEGEVEVEGEGDAKAKRRMEKKQKEEAEQNALYYEYGASEDEDGKMVVEAGSDAKLELEEMSKEEGNSSSRRKHRTNMFVISNTKLMRKAAEDRGGGGRDWQESKAALPGAARRHKIKDRNIDRNKIYYHECGRTRLDDTDEEVYHFLGGALDLCVEEMETPNSKHPHVPWSDDMEELADKYCLDEDSVSAEEDDSVKPECLAQCDDCEEVVRDYVTCYHEYLDTCGVVKCLQCVKRRKVPATAWFCKGCTRHLFGLTVRPVGYSAADVVKEEERSLPDQVPQLWTDPDLRKRFTHEQKLLIGGKSPSNITEFRFAQLHLIGCDVKYDEDRTWMPAPTYFHMCSYFRGVLSYNHESGLLRTTSGLEVWFRVSRPPSRDAPRLPYVKLKGIDEGPGGQAAMFGGAIKEEPVSSCAHDADLANDADDESSRFSGSGGPGGSIPGGGSGGSEPTNDLPPAEIIGVGSRLPSDEMLEYESLDISNYSDGSYCY